MRAESALPLASGNAPICAAVEARTAALTLVDHPVFEAIAFSPLYKVSSGSGSAPATPKGTRAGPTPRTKRALLLPDTTTPNIKVWLPDPAWARAEKFAIRLKAPGATVIVKIEVVV